MQQRLNWCSNESFRVSRHSTVSWTALFLVVVAISSGCGRVEQTKRVAIGGKVTNEGDPILEKAMIYFEAEDGTSFGTAGEVKDGYFSIPQETGPTPGKSYHVVVMRFPSVPGDANTPLNKILEPKLSGSVDIPDEGSSNLEIELRE